MLVKAALKDRGHCLYTLGTCQFPTWSLMTCYGSIYIQEQGRVSIKEKIQHGLFWIGKINMIFMHFHVYPRSQSKESLDLRTWNVNTVTAV